MYSRAVKKKIGKNYHEWLKDEGHSILSPRHRGIYAEMIFKKYCHDNNILAIKINPNYNFLEQIPANFSGLLGKKEAKNLAKIGKIRLDFFCVDGQKRYFAVVKMGTSNMVPTERLCSGKVRVCFLFRIFEDGDIFIRKVGNDEIL